MSDTMPKNSITIKKYANRRLYNTATSSYVTLQDLSQMVKDGIEFNVYDAKTSEDITRSVLTQIIVEEEGKSGQQNLLPIGFLRQLISFYGDSLQWMVPKYLEQSMQALTGNQDQIRSAFQSAFGNIFPFGTTLEEMSKQNLAMFERTMRMFTPFGGDTNPLAALSSFTGTLSPLMTKSAEVVSATTQATTATVAKAESKPAPACETPKAAACKLTPAPEPTKKSDDSNVTSLKPRTESKEPAPAPMQAVKAATASSASAADDMQQKIANLQKQLADLAKSRAH